MALDLNNEDYKIFRNSFKKFLKTEVIPHYNEWEEKGIIPKELYLKAGKMGYLCPWLEEKYGGPEAGLEYSVIIAEEMVKAGAIGVLFPLHSDIVAPYIYSFGTEEQKLQWLPKFASGEIISAIAMTEPNTGSDLAAITTTAVLDGDEYVINGAKTFISNGINTNLVVVACKTDPKAIQPHRGISLIVVEEGTPGFIRGRKLDKMGFRCQDTAELFFEDCRVPRANLLGVEGMGFKYLMLKLQQERLFGSIWGQAMAEKMLNETMDYCKSRNIFGKPVSAFQHNSFKLAEMATEVELGRAFLDSLVADHIAGKNVVKKVSMAKYWINEMANRIAYDCLQLHGGYGYMEEYPICRDYRDVRIFTIFAGTSEVMKSIIAKEIGL
ncbi:acyl-CoA dehydrogenase family protein [Desulfosporosinus sp. BICA1-9]|uniref:acyl-CoA dehydrogenase family protein n=1 Tax=Desulfosporosinus sp. BICA1-9 TaxID=1531958 RepID=UPI00054C3548|nr:acyl-CoA dehydrogenase family protein [Desulfosporosinus sp. BICA1-9]KJS88533.1 MAG: acyl-CoA dehydrogenase [Desulfosporosinus sp. BICA1-9]